MRRFLLLFLFLVAQGFSAVNGACPTVDSSYQLGDSSCNSGTSFDSTNLAPHYLDGGTQVALAFSFKIDDMCSFTTEAIGFNHYMGGSTGRNPVKRNVFQIRATTPSKYTSYIIDTTTGTRKLSEINVDPTDGWTRTMYFIDLQNNKVSQYWVSSIDYVFKEVTDANFGGLLTKSGMFLDFGSAAGAPYIKMTSTDYTFWYTPISKYFPFIQEQATPALLASFLMAPFFGSNLLSSVGSTISSATLGTAPYSPTWKRGAMKFTDPSQYVLFTTPSGSLFQLANQFFTKSLTVSFTVKLDELANGHLLYRTSSSSQIVFAVDITSSGVVKAIIADTTIATSQNSLQVGHWTVVTVSFAVHNAAKAAAVIFFGDVHQNPSIETNPLTSLTGTFAEAGTDIIKIGGFKGSLKNFNVIGPAASQVTATSCLADCALDIGVRETLCIVPICPSDKYINGASCAACDSTCLTCDGPGPKDCLTCHPTQFLSSDNACKYANEDKDESHTGAIIAGAVAFTVVSCSGILLYIAKRKNLLKKLTGNKRKVEPKPSAKETPHPNDVEVKDLTERKTFSSTANPPKVGAKSFIKNNWD